jgi:hypothetical protein
VLGGRQHHDRDGRDPQQRRDGRPAARQEDPGQPGKHDEREHLAGQEDDVLVLVHQEHVRRLEPGAVVVAEFSGNSLVAPGVGVDRPDRVTVIRLVQAPSGMRLDGGEAQVVGLDEGLQGLAGHHAEVGERLRADGVDGEPERPGVVGRGERRGVRHEPGVVVTPRPGPVVPQVPLGLGPLGRVGLGKVARLRVRAECLQVGGRLDDRAVGERHRSRPQEQPVAVGQVERAVHRGEPAHVREHRNRPGQQRSADAAPSCLPDQQKERNQQDQRQGGGPDRYGRAHHQAGHRHPPHRR